MKLFQRKRVVYHKNTNDKQTHMEGEIIEQLADPPTKMPTKLKSFRAFLRGCIRAAAGCFYGFGPNQTEDSMGKYCGYL